MHEMHEICTRYRANTCNTYTYNVIHHDTIYGLTPLLYVYVLQHYTYTYSTHRYQIHTYEILHVSAWMACICMYVWLPAATNDAGASWGNTTGGQHHGDCPCRSSPCSAHSISNEIMMSFIYLKRRLRR